MINGFVTQCSSYTDKLKLLEPAENIGVGLEPWALFVNICVSEIE